jgi:hypothetical protein
MVTAIAFVLVVGTGYSQMQSYGTLMGGGFGSLAEFGQSADCAGLANSCGNDNSERNGPGNGDGDGNGEGPIGPVDPSECALCLAELTDAQEAALFLALDVDTIAEACVAIGELSATALLTILLEDLDLSLSVALDLLACLGVDVDLLDI